MPSSSVSLQFCLWKALDVRFIRLLGLEGNSALNTSPFQNRVNEIGTQILEGLFRSTRPGNFYFVDGSPRSNAKVKAKIVLREVTGASPHFIELSKIAGLHR